MRKSKRVANYMRVMVIVHGQSEYYLAKNIFSNLRLKHHIIAENKGKNSIQINGLEKILGNMQLKNNKVFKDAFQDIEYLKKDPVNFKLFIIMDVDDCTEEMKNDYISKKLFDKHWLKDSIVPIYNDPNLEATMKVLGIAVKNKNEYIRIFPTNQGDADPEKIRELIEKLTPCKSTNLEVFLKSCLEIAEKSRIC